MIKTKYAVFCDDRKEAWDLYVKLRDYLKTNAYYISYNNISNCVVIDSHNIGIWTGLRSVYCPYKHAEYIYVEAAEVKEFLKKQEKATNP